jgi:hypothetical protein
VADYRSRSNETADAERRERETRYRHQTPA